MSGYIKLYRQIMDNPFWQDKPFSRGQAWIDLLMLANWGDSKVLDGSEIVTLHRGELVCSQMYLADRWGWSRKKVKGFLEVLQREHMGSVKGTSKGTTLTIENYSKYQDEGTAEGTAQEHQKSSAGTSKAHTIRRIKKSNKNKEILERRLRESVPIKYSEDETRAIISQAHQQFMEMHI